MEVRKPPTHQESLYLQMAEAQGATPNINRRLKIAAAVLGGIAAYSLKRHNLPVAAVAGGAAGLLAVWGHEPNLPSAPPVSEQALAAIGALG